MSVGDTVKFIDVVDADGAAMAGFENPVPAHWVGTDLLPAGAKKKGRSGGSSTPPATANDGVPAKSETREVLEAYAVDKGGLTEDEAKAFANKDELHAELVKRASDNS